jgi:hypothetical protein
MTAKEYLSQAYKIDNSINSKLEQISVDMDYSIQHTFKLHDQGLKEIEGFLKVES